MSTLTPVRAPVDVRPPQRPSDPGPPAGGRTRWLPSADLWTGRRVPYLLAGVFFALYAALSVRKHQRIESNAYDLGIFEQAVRAYAHGRAPVSEIRGLNLLGDHFSPVVAALAPLYRLFPSAYTLLLAQAALMAISVVPVTRHAGRRFGDRTALAVGVAYGLSWGLQQAVAFDFHEICFAVPLLAMAMPALAEGRHRAAVCWALPLVLVKEDLGVTVAAVGGCVFLAGRRRLGAAVVAAGLACTALTVTVLLPAVNPGSSYEYAGTVTTTVPGLSGWPVKLGTLLLLLAPTAFVALRSPLLLVAVPTLGWRFLAEVPNYWIPAFHYSAVLMPVLFTAFVDGLDRLRPATGVRLRRAAVAVSLVFALGYGCLQPLARLADPGFWHDDRATVSVRAMLAEIPDGSTVTASNSTAAQLTSRCRVGMFRTPAEVTSEWVVVDLRRPWPASTEGIRRAADELTVVGYRRVAEHDGILLLRR